MPPKLSPAAFIDRDGVINVERNYVHRIEDFELIPEASAGLKNLLEQGYMLVVVTNQAGIARGLYDIEAFHALSKHMMVLLSRDEVEFAGIFFCPHHPNGCKPEFSKMCDCRKPSPGLLFEAAKSLGIDLSRSVMIGDKVSDIIAGQAASVRYTILVRSGHDLTNIEENYASHCCDNLKDAAVWLKLQSG